LAKRAANTFTFMSSGPIGDLLRADAILRLGLQVESCTVRVTVGGETISQQVDASLSGPFSLKREFVREPSLKKVDRLRCIGEQLRSNREPAFYSEQDFSENHSDDAVRLLEEANEVAACFLIKESPRWPYGGTSSSRSRNSLQAYSDEWCARHGADLGGVSPLRADWPEPLAEGNCVVARRGGKEAGGETRSRRTGTG
jgi:hypothetical protein